MLEAILGTCVLANCLSDPENSPDIVKSNKKYILQSDFKLLLSSATQYHGSAAPAAHTHASRHRLWDVALDHGVKGTRIMQAIFRELYAARAHVSSVCCATLKFLLTVHAWNTPAQTTLVKWRTSLMNISFPFSFVQTLLPLSFLYVNVFHTVKLMFLDL